MKELRSFRRKTRLVHGVQWTGIFKDLPKILRMHKHASTFKGRIEIMGNYTVLKRGNVTSGIKVGDWLLMDEDGRLEVMSDERFRLEYNPDDEEEAA